MYNFFFFFLVDSSLFLSIAVQQLVVIFGVLLRGGEFKVILLYQLDSLPVVH